MVYREPFSDGSVGLRESFEPVIGPKLVLDLGANAQKLDKGMCTVDVIGGTLTTLADGRRAIVRPSAVYAYTIRDGQYAPPLPWSTRLPAGDGLGDIFASWPWKVKLQ
jgi:hypothetical protein